jgi:hypothetical protein
VLFFIFFVLVHVWGDYVINFHPSRPRLRPQRRRRRRPRPICSVIMTITSILSYYTRHQMYHTEADNSDTLYQRYVQSGFQKVHSLSQIQSYNSDYKSHYISPFVYTHLIHDKMSYPDCYKHGMFDSQNNVKRS